MTSRDLLYSKIEQHRRIDGSEAMRLLQMADLLTLGRLAHAHRLRHHPLPEVTYVVDRNINYTNICVSRCRFCAYYRTKHQSDAYIISRAELGQKIEETLSLGGTQILLQGGMHPDLGLEWCEALIRYIKEHFDIHIHGFSPTEILYMAEKAGLGVPETLERLMAAGLGSIPGGGAEILVDTVRHKISPNKCSADSWLHVMRCAHQIGLNTTATMMFGHVESMEDLITHLLKIRALQDDTGGFTAFIPWSFQPLNTQIQVAPATAVEYLRVLAVSRLVLDNIPNLQASWVTQGDKIAQLALTFGANDMGSTMIEENVVAAAGVHFRLPKDEMIRLIESAGYRAVQRNYRYEPITPNVA